MRNDIGWLIMSGRKIELVKERWLLVRIVVLFVGMFF